MAASARARPLSERLTLTEPAATAALVGAATLLFEIALTRLFSLTQGYHFAFLSVSLALLGNAAGGAAVASGFPSAPSLRRPALWSAVAAPAMLVVLVAMALLPVDTYALAWSPRQVVLSLLLIGILALPMALVGVSLALCFESGRAAGSVYAANLTGSGAGALAAALMLPIWGPVQALAIAAAVAATAVLWLGTRRRLVLIAAVVLAALVPWERMLSPRLSPYQPLWHALQAQGSDHLASYWSRYGRIDVVAGPNLRMAGGVSLECPYSVPEQIMVYVDADSPSPILAAGTDRESDFVECLPAWAALRLREPQRSLVLQPAGDVPLWLALRALPGSIEAVEPNPGLRAALANERWGSAALDSSRLTLAGDNPRALLRGGDAWDLIFLPLRGAYRPVGLGAGSLAEDYALTTDALGDAFAALSRGGYLVAESWLQQPPTEELRLWLTVIAALREHGIPDPGAHLLAARSMQTVVIAASPSPWTGAEVADFRRQAEALSLDLVWAPGLRAEDTNLHNVLPQDVYFQAFAGALGGGSLWTTGYDFDVVPATDSRPFPHSYFRWSHTERIVRQLGHVALPLGGVGFLLLPLLLLVLGLLSTALLVPALVRVPARPRPSTVAAFVALGLGYLAVEMPLMQAAMLVVQDAPSSMAVVLSAMLLGSGLAGGVSEWRPSRGWLLAPLCGVAAAVGAIGLLPALLAAPEWAQVGAVFTLAALVGFGLGGAFPTLMRLRVREPGQRAWAVAANGGRQPWPAYSPPALRCCTASPQTWRSPSSPTPPVPPYPAVVERPRGMFHRRSMLPGEGHEGYAAHAGALQPLGRLLHQP